MEGGDTGVHEAMRRAWAEASYWLSGMSVAAGAPSYSGDPEEGEAGTGWARGAACAEGPRKNWAPSPLDIPAVWAPGVMEPLVTDHRLGYWLKCKRGDSQAETWSGAPDRLREGQQRPTTRVLTRARTASSKQVTCSVSQPHPEATLRCTPHCTDPREADNTLLKHDGLEGASDGDSKTRTPKQGPLHLVLGSNAHQWSAVQQERV